MNKVVCSVLAVAVLGCSAASLAFQGDDNYLDGNMEEVIGWGPVVLLVLSLVSMASCLAKKSQLTMPMCVLSGLGLVAVSIYLVVEHAPHAAGRNERDILPRVDTPTQTPVTTTTPAAFTNTEGFRSRGGERIHVLNITAGSFGIVLGLAMLGCAATGLPKRAAASPNRKSPPRRR
jgi:hypothetical protein